MTKTLENLVDKFVKKIIGNKVKTILAVGLASLIGITALKDNVHFGSTNIYNQIKNHYVWGVIPNTKVQGQGNGSIYTFGLLTGLNDVRDNSTITGNQGAYSLLAGINDIGDNSTITGNQGAYSLLAGINDIGDNSTITGNQHAVGCIIETVGGMGVGTRKEIGLKQYVVKKEKKE